MATEPRPITLVYARHEPLPEGSPLRFLGIYAIVYGLIKTSLALEWSYRSLGGYGTNWGVDNPEIFFSLRGASLLAAVAVLLGGMRILRHGDTRWFSGGLLACTTLAATQSLVQLARLAQSNFPPERVTVIAAMLLFDAIGIIVVLWILMRLIHLSKELQDAEPQARTETWLRIHRTTAWLVIAPPLASLLGAGVVVVQHVLWPMPQMASVSKYWLRLGFSAAFALAGVAFYFRLSRAWLICTALAVISVPSPRLWLCAEFNSWQERKTVLMGIFTSAGGLTLLHSVPLATLLVLLLIHPRMRARNG